jgi:NADPH-dependent 2,4-dienoyl-CoA reductase/sulfur reductase-like enzyme
MAAALNMNQVDVTMIFPDAYLVSRVFPESLGRAIQNDYLDRGVKVLAGDAPASIEKSEDKFLVWTKNGEDIEADILVVGIGITPAVELAEMAKLELNNGVVENELLQTSNPNIYAAGDNANFPYIVLGDRRRVEHWDNALNQGQYAGRNMAGANQPYDYMPYFFSDLFDFGYEAVGEVDSRLQIIMDWQKENDTGVIYYLKDGKVRGAMMCNVWDKVDDARALIKEGKQMAPDDLMGRIK